MSKDGSARALVIGGGPAGLRAALDLADLGVSVTIVERQPTTGGTFSQLDVQYPTVDCGACQMHDSLTGPPWAERRCLRTGIDHPLVETLTSTSISHVEYKEGRAKVTLSQGHRWIDPTLCKNCGICTEICPESAADEHQAGTCTRAVAYRPHDLSFPPVHIIDEQRCTRCGECVPACPEGAIALDRPVLELTLDVDSIIVATGFDPFDAKLQPQWAYGRHPDIMTALELERHIRPNNVGGLTPLKRQSTGEPAKRVAFVQCVGSRDHERPYCSAVCCMHALKEAIVLTEQLDVPECHIFAIDMRCIGKGYERTLERALKNGVKIVNARPGAVELGSDRPLLQVDYPGVTQAREPYDVIVLSTGLVPSGGVNELSRLLDVELDDYGFIRVEPGSTMTSRKGVFVCGAASGPSDLPWSVTTASQAALAAAAHAGVPSGATQRSASHPDDVGPPQRLTHRLKNLPEIPIRTNTLFKSAETPVAVVPRALILGAGPAGLTAARAIGRAGFEVLVVDTSDRAGGNLLDAKRLLGTRTPREVLKELVDDISALDNVELLLGWELVSHDGAPGDYTAQLNEISGTGGRKERHGALIVATGCGEFSPQESGDFSDVFEYPTVITQRELEARLDSATPLIGAEESQEKARPTVVMIQCVGSREPERPWCSRVCCHEALKNSLWIKERYPGAQVFILHRDLRALGFDELHYERARLNGVVALRTDGSSPKIEAKDGGVSVRYIDPVLGRPVRIESDLVVLSAGMQPRLTEDRATTLGLRLGPEGFVNESNPKYRPVEADRRGLLVAGAAQGPVLVPEAIAQAEAAALRAVSLLSREVLAPRPGAVRVSERWCMSCGLCVEVCPAGARRLDDDHRAVVQIALCQGCGTCAAACPSGCTDQPDLGSGNVLELIEAALEVV